MWAKHTQQPGFTIVELLIVIVIIGILAAITVVAFNGIQGRANDTAITSDLTNIAKQLETIKITSSNTAYPTTGELANNANNRLSAAKGSYEKSRNNLYYCRTTDNMHYAIGAVSTSGKNFYLVDGKTIEATGVWGSTTCDQLASFGTTTGATSGYDSVGNAWSTWIK
ncbi:Type II secretion system protein G precursor [compost metagenome]